MGKPKTIDFFFKRKVDENVNEKEAKRSKVSTSESENQQKTQEPQVNEEEPQVNQQEDPIPQPENDEGVLDNLERDPAKRKPLWKYHVNIREQVRRAYLSLGPYQIHLNNYANKGSSNHTRRFQFAWFSIYPNWLEYSPTTHSAYCFMCYLFSDYPSVSHGYDAFTVKGFDNWKKVNGKTCAFLKHIGTNQHRNALTYSENLLNQRGHIENLFENQSEEQIKKNRVRLRTTVDVVRWLTFQACALRGHDESSTSKNRGNFLELLKLLASYNDEVAKVILGNAPYNSKYTSSLIQKECLSIIANKVRRHIRSEVGDSYFCVMVDESRDESKKEQMAIVLRFVDSNGYIRERFLDLVHVMDTTSATLYASLFDTLSKHTFDHSKIRGQGYDGASNMRGEWNGLQALVLKQCPYAYYVHCFAHRLQLALVGASKEVIQVQQFFTHLVGVINVVCGSSKRHDELQKAKSDEIKDLLEIGEIKSGKGLNQVGTLRRAGDTRWGSHFKSICSLLNMFDVTCVVLKGIRDEKTHTTPNQRGEADGALGNMESFLFVFILHLMKEVLGKTETLNKAIQKKSQDILNAMELVASTKESLQELRNSGWDSFLTKVTFFCNKHRIEVPDWNAPYTSSRYRPRRGDLHFTFEHYYRVDLFTTSLDIQLHELDSRFNEKSVELLSLSCTLMTKEIKINEICSLVEKYYPTDFTEKERIQLGYQLELFNIEMTKNSKMSDVSTLAGACEFLAETKKRENYYLVDRVMRLILTLPVSTATTERGFSAMKIFKNRLRNRMSDDFLANSMMVYIEKDIAESFDSDSIIEEFKNLKGRRAEL